MSGCSRSASTATLSPWIDVEDAVRDARLLQQLGREDRRRRVLLRRLEHEGVAARERGRPHPHGHHRREVERRDPGDDAERLADRVDVDPGRGLLRVVALEQRRDPADVLDHLDPALHLAQRVGEHLAVLGREQAREVLAVLVEELVDAEHQVGALRERPLPPGGERRLRRGDRAVDLLDAREGDLARLLAGRRVVDRPRAAGAPRTASPPIQWPISFSSVVTAAIVRLPRSLPEGYRPLARRQAGRSGSRGRAGST